MINCPHTSSDEKCEACKTLEHIAADLGQIRIMASQSTPQSPNVALIERLAKQCLRRIERLQKGK